MGKETRGALRSSSFYTALRLSQVGALAIGALALTQLLPLGQYAIYARGALFSTPFAAIYLMGQDQLCYQGRLRLRTFRWRAVAVQAGAGAIVGALIVGSTPIRLWAVLGSSCLGTAAMTVTAATWVSLQSQHRDAIRASAQLGNAVTIQLAALAAAAVTGSALWATNAATATAIVWMIATLGHRGDRSAADAPFRAALGVGLGGASYGLMSAAMSIIIAVRASDVAASQDRVLLLVLSGVLAACGALNSEYFRNLLYSSRSRREVRRIGVAMKKANLLLGAMVTAGVVASAVVLPSALPPAYGGLHQSLLEMAPIVPALFVATASFTVEIAAGRTFVVTLRNIVVAVAAPVALGLLAPTTANLVLVVVVTEVSGAIVAAGSLALARRRRDPLLVPR